MRLALVATTLVLLLGCESHGGFGEQVAEPLEVPSPTATTREVRGPTRSVEIAAPGGLRFEPTEIAVSIGETVTFVFRNEDAEPHTFTVNELNLQMFAEAGETLRLTLVVPEVLDRRFEFYCSVAGHQESGMVGEVIIE